MISLNNFTKQLINVEFLERNLSIMKSKDKQKIIFAASVAGEHENSYKSAETYFSGCKRPRCF